MFPTAKKKSVHPIRTLKKFRTPKKFRTLKKFRTPKKFRTSFANTPGDRQTDRNTCACVHVHLIRSAHESAFEFLVLYYYSYYFTDYAFIWSEYTAWSLASGKKTKQRKNSGEWWTRNTCEGKVNLFSKTIVIRERDSLVSARLHCSAFCSLFSRTQTTNRCIHFCKHWSVICSK